ncbi:KDR, partial [Cordylochernes scorpioides]
MVRCTAMKAPELVSTNLNDTTVQLSPDSSLELLCEVRGKPQPAITWEREPPADLPAAGRLAAGGQRLVVPRLVPQDSGLYRCIAANRAGTTSASIRILVPGNGTSSEEIAIIAGLCSLGAIFLVVVLVLARRVYRSRKKLRELENLQHALMSSGQMELFNPDLPLQEQAELLPYDSRWEFPRDRLRLGKTLGTGAFGRVVQAEAIGLDGVSSTTVAVKMLKEWSDVVQSKALLAELKVLIHLGQHLNIVNLLGAVTKNLAKGELLVIVEYCRYGNLRDYLLRRRGTFVDQVDRSTGLVDSSLTGSEPTVHVRYQNSGLAICNPAYKYVLTLDTFQPLTSFTSHDDKIHTPCATWRYPHASFHLSPTAPDLQGYWLFSQGLDVNAILASTNGKSLHYADLQHDVTTDISDYYPDIAVTTSDLLSFSFQCARGMEYLASKK